MTLTSRAERARTAFLALDFTDYVVENFSHDAAIAERAANALALARNAGLMVIHVVPEQMRGQIHPLLSPTRDEQLLGKTSIGAFATTNLREVLRASDVGRVIVAGIATSGTVLSTARWAADIGYEVIVCADACADPDPEVHAALLDESVFPTSWIGLWRIARVLESSQIDELRA
jgi:nicotinamidase-related amidase